MNLRCDVIRRFRCQLWYLSKLLWQELLSAHQNWFHIRGESWFLFLWLTVSNMREDQILYFSEIRKTSSLNAPLTVRGTVALMVQTWEEKKTKDKKTVFESYNLRPDLTKHFSLFSILFLCALHAPPPAPPLHPAPPPPPPPWRSPEAPSTLWQVTGGGGPLSLNRWGVMEAGCVLNAGVLLNDQICF